jgi:hypothetical protein
MRYLFHNIYGDANHLIETAPSDVICVPFGWSDEIEKKRNELLATLDTSVSCLPSLIVEKDGKWQEIRIEDLPKPWTWETITS